jgi:Tol biopolymer transport system component
MLSLIPGTRLGDYEIVETLGAGAMGVVYRAHDVQLQRTVAIKVLTSHSSQDISRQQLLLEARAASALNHPGICTVHQVEHASDYEFIVMEFVDGGRLNEHIPANGLRFDLVLRYSVQIADALAHAHARGVIHRDLKSSNVLVTKAGQVKIVDFGLAKVFVQATAEAATRSNSGATDSGPMAGTLAYMAPEVLGGEQPSAGSDLWAFGVLLHEMATGTLPFTGRTSFEMTAQILRSPLSPLPPHVPASLRTIISNCLTKERSQRYQSAREVRAALEAVQSDAAIVPLVGTTIRPRSVRPLKLAGALIGAVVLAAVTWFVVSARREPSSTGGQLVQVLASERPVYQPAVSPDATMIAYVAEDNAEQFDLYVNRVAGGARVRVTNDDARETAPRFSPNGERLAFARRRPGVPHPEICVIPTFGGQLSVAVNNAGQPAWSPDGTRLAFIRPSAGRGSPTVLGVAHLDGSEERILLRGDGVYPAVRGPAWSPDGRSIVFVRGTGGVAGELWVVPAEGGEPRQVAPDPPGVFSDEPIFSADGRRIIHVSNRGGATNIWEVPVDGGAAVRLTTGSGPDESPTIARNGNVAFLNSRWRNELFLHPLRSGERLTLTRHTPYLWAPTFSPTGEELAVSRSEVDGSWHIWIVGHDGTTRQLTSGSRGEIYSTWTPDGKHVLFHEWTAPHRVWRVPREGGPPVALTPEGVDASYGAISPDGKSLAFVVTEGSEERVYIQSVANSAQRRLLRSGPASVPRWSPDGNWIAFSPDRSYYSGVFIIRADGTDERQLSSVGGWPVWWPDSRQVSFIRTASDGTQQIDIASVDGKGATAPVHLRFRGLNHPFDISRDSAWLATSDSAHVSSEIWVIQH